MSGLIELKRNQDEEPGRRWFYSTALDLIVWHADDGALTAFELYYDKQSSEHVLTWQAERGFGHFAVDDGEQKPVGEYKQTPILVADGDIDAGRILRLFEGVSAQLPSEVAGGVRERLAGFPGTVI